MGRMALETLDKKTQKRLNTFAESINKATPNNLLSIIVFGDTAATGNASNRIQSLIILKEINVEFLASYIKIRKRFPDFAPPLFFTYDLFKSSTDVFPMEILNIKDAYMVLYGEDLLHDITITFEDLRAEVEQQVKRQYLKLLDEFLYSLERKSDLEQLLTTSLITFAPLFKNILRLIKKECPIEGTLFKEFCSELGLDDIPFFNIWDIKTGTKRFTKKELLTIFDSFIKEIEKLINKLETLNSEEGYCIN